MRLLRYIIKRMLFFELTVDGEGSGIILWEASFGRGGIRFEQKVFGEDQWEKWKHNLAFLLITGDQVVSKLYRKEHDSIKKITENNELLWSITPMEAGEECMVSFLRKDMTGGFMENLRKNDIYILDKRICRNNTLSKEELVAGFYEKEMTFSAIRKIPGRLNALCNMMYYKLRLPVLLLFFFLLLGNFFINTTLREEYEAIQAELNMKRRNDKVLQENQKKRSRLQAEYQKIPDCSFALIADRIASYVPANVQLNLLSVFPLESAGGIVNRHKELKIKTGTVVVKGEVEIPGSVTLFTQFLSSDHLFSKVEILSLTRLKNSSLFSFELLITL